MATLSHNNIAQAIYLSLKGKGPAGQKVVFKNVVSFLSRRRLLAKSPGILLALRKIINQEQGLCEVQLWSKNKISGPTKKKLTPILRKRYGKQKFIWRDSLDEKLLGGLKIEINNEIIDLTLRHKIYQLKEHLMTSHE